METDWFARALAATSLGVAGLALWLNWQKNERDLAALRPQVAIRADRRGTRAWWVRVTLVNPRQVPMFWRTVHAVDPPGLAFLGELRPDAHEPPKMLAGHGSDYLFVPGYPVEVPPGGSSTWEGWCLIDDRFPAFREVKPLLTVGVDGFDQRPSRLRRIAKWIWPRAMSA